MLAIKRKPDIIFCELLIEAVMLYMVVLYAVSSPDPDGEVDLAANLDTSVRTGSSKNSQFTGKQLRIISLLLEGKSNSQIALQLGVCTRTVEYHLSRIYESLGIGSRGEAIIKLIRLFEK